MNQDADYVLALKGNRGRLHEAVVDFFYTAHQNAFQGVSLDYFEEIESGHERVEVRRNWTTTVPDTLPNIDANPATLRHFALNLLKAGNTMKKGIKQKRLKAGWGDGYRTKVLFG